MLNPVLFKSNQQNWETPSELFAQLNSEFHFDIDVCALPSNAKCKRFYSPEDDGLLHDWHGICWMNPPYGREIGKWVKKAATSAKTTAHTVVCLIPARTDTKWWHDSIWDATKHQPMNGVEIRFLPGRVRFIGGAYSAPFPSAVVVFHNVAGGA